VSAGWLQAQNSGEAQLAIAAGDVLRRLWAVGLFIVLGAVTVSVATWWTDLLIIRSDLIYDEQLRAGYVAFLYGVLAIGFLCLIWVAGANHWAIGDIAGNVSWSQR